MESFIPARRGVCSNEARGFLTGLMVFLLVMGSGVAFADLGFGPPMPLSPDAGDNVGYDFQPVVAAGGSRVWIAAWNHSEISIDMSRSTDGGVTWSPPQAIDIYGGEVMGGYHHQLATDGSGVWICVWESWVDLGIGNTDGELFFRRSTDNGATWEEGQILNTNALTDTESDQYPHIAADGSGNWVAVWHTTENIGGTAGTDQDIVFSRSTDNGVTWSPPALLNSFHETDVLTDRVPRVATDRAGRWIVVWDAYVSGGIYDVFYSLSGDNGGTWSTPVSLPTSGMDIRPDVASDGKGNWVVVWQTYDYGGPTGADYDLFSSHSTDNGANWSTPVPLHSTAWTDSLNDGYPRLAADRLGDWLVVWQHFNIPLGGGGGTKEVYVSRSQDNGVTWSPPESLGSDTTLSDVNLGGTDIATEGWEKWIVVWHSDDNIGGTIGTDRDILFSSSFILGEPSVVEKEEWILYR